MRQMESQSPGHLARLLDLPVPGVSKALEVFKYMGHIMPRIYFLRMMSMTLSETCLFPALAYVHAEFQFYQALGP